MHKTWNIWRAASAFNIIRDFHTYLNIFLLISLRSQHALVLFRIRTKMIKILNRHSANWDWRIKLSWSAFSLRRNFNFNLFLCTKHIAAPTHSKNHHLILISTWVLIRVSWVGRVVTFDDINTRFSKCLCSCSIARVDESCLSNDWSSMCLSKTFYLVTDPQ